MRVLLILAYLCSWCLDAHAEQYALLVGLSHYAAANGRFDLEGPEHDVTALAATLTGRYKLKSDHVHILLNERATKANILQGLEALVKAAHPGDSLLFYFSGHGTSAFDRGMLPVASMIGPNSGAIVPYDLDLSTPEAAGISLIIGHRDLKPILSALNPQARGWVVLDSCYSENAVRALDGWEGPARAINLVQVFTDRSPESRQAGALEGQADTTGAGQAADADENYPYANVISYSAASRDETARDINRAMLASGRFHTADGQPHGAFTSGLLAALNGAADTNHDGKITYDELFRATREIVEGSSRQRPQILPHEGGSIRDLVLRDPDQAAQEVNTGSAPPADGRGGIRLALDGLDARTAQILSAVPDVVITSGGFDLLVREAGGQLELRDRSRGLIQAYPKGDLAPLVQRIAAQREVERLVNYVVGEQRFNVNVDVGLSPLQGMLLSDGRAEYGVGEHIGVSLRAERSAYLLALDIDTSGVVSILYPVRGDVEPVTSGTRDLVLRTTVSRPTGTEFIKVIGFAQKPAGFDSFTCVSPTSPASCPEIEPSGPRFRMLLQMLQASAGDKAEARTKLLTKE